MKPLDLLDCAIDLLSEPEHWAKEALALDGRGRPVRANDPTAVAYCLQGALDHCYTAKTPNGLNDKTSRQVQYAIRSVLPPRARGSIPRFNDHKQTTHKSMMRVLKAAREKLANAS